MTTVRPGRDRVVAGVCGLLAALFALVVVDCRLGTLPQGSRLALFDLTRTHAPKTALNDRETTLAFVQGVLSEGGGDGASVSRGALLATTRGLIDAARPMLWAHFRLLDRLQDRDVDEFVSYCENKVVTGVVTQQDMPSLRQRAAVAFGAAGPPSLHPMPRDWDAAREAVPLRKRWHRVHAAVQAAVHSGHVVLESANKILIMWLVERQKAGRFTPGERVLLASGALELAAAAERTSVAWEALRKLAAESAVPIPNVQGAQDMSLEEMLEALESCLSTAR